MLDYAEINIDSLVDEVNDKIKAELNEAECVSTEALGLDPRAGMVWVTDDGIIVSHGYARSLNYYGGFEYVDSDCVTQIGNYTFYSANDDRVNGCMERYDQYISSKS